jgi:hypothetical protein
MGVYLIIAMILTLGPTRAQREAGHFTVRVLFCFVLFCFVLFLLFLQILAWQISK